jgi:hypothetical protein
MRLFEMSAKEAYNESLKSQDSRSHKWYEATRDKINREIRKACKDGQFETYIDYPREMNVKYRDGLIAELQNDGYKVTLSEANGGLIRRFHITWEKV